MDRLKLRGAAKRHMPAGPDKAADGTPFATGIIYAVDPVACTVQVGVRGGVVTLPACAARYVIGSLARVLMDPIKQRPMLVLGAVNPSQPVQLLPITATGTGSVTVTWQGSPLTVATTGNTFTVGASAWVETDNWGTPYLALAPDGSVSDPGTVPVSHPPTTSVVTATASIGPQVTGTYRGSVSPSWNEWNPGRYGLGNYPIYQGNAYGSGLLVGFAGYGNQIVNLHAISILSITMTAHKGADGNSAALVVQGSPSGSRPAGSPSSSGDTATTGSVSSGGTGSLAFTSNMCTAFRTGAAKGLVAVGSQYGGFAGYGVPPSFVLHVRYTKNS